MVYHDIIQVATVSFSDDNMSSPGNSSGKQVRVFFANTPLNGDSLGGDDGKDLVEQSTVANLLSEAIELHGTGIFPTNCFPPITNASASSELQSLIALRDQYVERFTRLNQLGVPKQDVDEDDEDDVQLGRNKAVGSVSRLRDHKKNKERVRLELKEVIQALAGIMADHKNVSIADVISEYKNY